MAKYVAGNRMKKALYISIQKYLQDYTVMRKQ